MPRAVRDDILIAVDHEGGRVQRFRTDGFTVLPAMRPPRRAVGSRRAARDESGDRGRLHPRRQLRACGIDMSFTPVLDPRLRSVAGDRDRAFHRDPRVVTLLAKSLNHGLALAGMANCGKHFPGHGFAEADSHVALPTDDRSRETILAHDVAPYDWLGLSLSAVIPAHVIYNAGRRAPAGFSRVWLQDILRGRLGFYRRDLHDDLSMEAAREGGTLTQAADAALAAGCDMVLVCNQPEAPKSC
ncbi:beta-N-acetylhexosaminidase [Burkholderia multivorans]|uniref:beta-N-acetylhexosaminidase n=1 Tax=Burkholderia multivorans TaxID=87883 RepID=UPI00201AEE35|nr:beta-N-acetylhexosaminidase [Burkholderia multivorans]MCL4624898.1 beta-N-acetylhexosaminidase [Burkholderia multivorans]